MVAGSGRCCQLAVQITSVEFGELVLWQLEVARKHRVLLQQSTALLLQSGSVDLVPCPHMRVLLAPLLKRLAASEDGTCERLLPRVNPHVVLQRTHGLAAPATVLAGVRALAQPALLVHTLGIWLASVACRCFLVATLGVCASWLSIAASLPATLSQVV